MSPRSSCQIAIIGGGVMGAWTAFFLARRGATGITIIERSFAGAQASGVNYGNIRIQGRNLPQMPLSLRAQELWLDAEKLLGRDVEVRISGHMMLALTPEHLDRNATYLRMGSEYGYFPEQLDQAELRRRWPWITPSALGASYSAIDGAVNPRLVTPAIAARLGSMGVTLREGCQVSAANRQGAGFRLSLSDGSELDADVVVNCAGAWGAGVAEWFGETVPLFVAGPTEMVTEPLPYFMGPTLQATDGSILVRQVERGNVVVAGHPRGPADAVNYRSRMAGNKTLVNLQKVVAMVPRLAGASIIRTWSGIEGYLPDMNPVMGPSITTPGLFHAFGYSGGGMQLSTGVGAVMAELVLDGRSPTPTEAFSAARFLQETPLAEHLNTEEEFDLGVVKLPTAP